MDRDNIQPFIREQLIARDRTFINNANELFSLYFKAADSFREWDKPDLAAQLKAELTETLQLRRKMESHVQALEFCADAYSFNREVAVPFESLIDSKASQFLSRRFDVEETEEFKTLMECMKRSTEAAARQAEKWDDELQIVDDGSLASNTHCPLTGKALEDLIAPVIDEAGYVYDREAIRAYIERNPDGTGDRCPVAGTSHNVSLATLKPAYTLVRVLKRKRREQKPADEVI